MARDPRKHVLMVEDDELFRRSVAKVLGDAYRLSAVGSVPEAIERLGEGPVDLVLLDMMLPGPSGIDLLRHLRSRAAAVPVIVLTAVDRVANVVEAMRQGAADYLTKPLRFEELEVAIERALETQEMRSEVDQRRTLQLESNRRHRLLGESAAIERIRREVATVGPTDATVLVTGETGTGKELVARGIHAASPRASGPFVAVNCGAVPKDLFESEFFGHRKGAFTGADSRSAGKLRLAHQGTLLLDEVGELPLDAQVKLLRALEEQQFYPVGSSELVTVDTRLVASTHRDLTEMVEEGAFREDLFFRLNVFQIAIPPLRERGEDVMVLARHFVEALDRKFGKSFASFTPGAERLLHAHPWKGNVRELRNVLERVVLSESGETIAEEHLWVLGRAPRTSGGSGDGGAFRLPEAGVDLEELEKDLMRQALERAGGNKTQAARLLHLSPPTFYYRIEKYGLS